MSNPVIVDLPHNLGAGEAQRRIANGIDGLASHIPGGAVVHSSWTGNRMNLLVRALSQEVSANIDVQERIVRVEVVLPPALGFVGRAIEKALRRKGTAILEDKRDGGGA